MHQTMQRPKCLPSSLTHAWSQSASLVTSVQSRTGTPVVEHARGEFIVMLSDDDYLAPHFLSRCDDVLARSDEASPSHCRPRRRCRSRHRLDESSPTKPERSVQGSGEERTSSPSFFLARSPRRCVRWPSEPSHFVTQAAFHRAGITPETWLLGALAARWGCRLRERGMWHPVYTRRHPDGWNVTRDAARGDRPPGPYARRCASGHRRPGDRRSDREADASIRGTESHRTHRI